MQVSRTYSTLLGEYYKLSLTNGQYELTCNGKIAASFNPQTSKTLELAISELRAAAEADRIRNGS